jgi:hypothetical protein
LCAPVFRATPGGNSNEIISEFAYSRVPEDKTDAIQSGCIPKSGKTAGWSSGSCKPFETKANYFYDDDDDGDGALMTLPHSNKKKAWKKI